MYFTNDIARLFGLSATSIAKWLEKGYIPRCEKILPEIYSGEIPEGLSPGKIPQELYPKRHESTGFRIWDSKQYHKWELIAKAIRFQR